jgi:hypothetical protein
MQRRRCRAGQKNDGADGAGMEAGRVTGLAERLSIIYTFPLFSEIS